MAKLLESLLLVANYCFENGELLNAYQLLDACPAELRESVLELKGRIRNRLEEISDFQTLGRSDAGFIDPPDVSNKKAYQMLKDKLDDLDISTLVDVGCFSGWVGRNLSMWGYKVHGIDLDAGTLNTARLMATGTLATYEVLESLKLGTTHPKEYDGAIIFDVLEHVFDPYLFLKSVEDSVTGWVFINLPYPRIIDGVKPVPDHIKEHIRGFDKLMVDKIFKGKKDYSIERYVDENNADYWFISYRV